ncbi:hypothetical protein C8Q73DRAFT_715777 [Cubamyces lactineus]|nr:hypothetical protein C8Q73DRAFT_715777 [Cubamyces lactineus]
MDCVRAAHRHSTYYLFDGNVVLLLSASNTLYCLHRSTLSMDSGCFETLFLLPPESALEGTDDDHPVVIPNICSRDFDYLLDYKLRHSLPLDNQEALISVLNLGHFFQIAAAEADARRALEQSPGFSAALQYALGMKNRINDWIKAGFKKLVILPIDSLSAVDIELMGLPAYHALVSTKARIEAHRKYMAYVPPPIEHSPSCPFDIPCKFGWEREWKSGVSRLLLHPELHISGAQVLENLEAVKINDVHEECKQLTLGRLRRGEVLTREDTLVREAIRSLLG